MGVREGWGPIPLLRGFDDVVRCGQVPSGVVFIAGRTAQVRGRIRVGPVFEVLYSQSKTKKSMQLYGLVINKTITK